MVCPVARKPEAVPARHSAPVGRLLVRYRIAGGRVVPAGSDLPDWPPGRADRTYRPTPPWPRHSRPCCPEPSPWCNPAIPVKVAQTIDSRNARTTTTWTSDDIAWLLCRRDGPDPARSCVHHPPFAIVRMSPSCVCGIEPPILVTEERQHGARIDGSAGYREQVPSHRHAEHLIIGRVFRLCQCFLTSRWKVGTRH